MILGPAPGRLLVATAVLRDPSFSRTVVMLLDHDETGSLGVVLNRPTDREIATVLGPWVDFVDHPAQLFEGGPVGLESVIGLGTRARVAVEPGAEPLGWRAVVGELGMVDLDASAQSVGVHLGRLRIFLGYSGWGPGQLHDELAAGAWLVTEPEPADMFCDRPDQLWARVWRRQPGEAAFVSTRPDDPTLN